MKKILQHKTIYIKYPATRMALVLCVMIFSLSSTAQQEWGYSQYLFNLYDINSAYAGNHGAGSFGARYRSQWIGMAGAPESQYVSFHTPLLNERAGVGIKLLNENIGARNQTMAKASAAWKLQMPQSTLSFGLAGGVLRQAIERDALTANDPQDARLLSIGAPTITPLIDASIFFNTKKFYAGIESGRINRSSYQYDDASLARLYYNISIVSGYMHRVGESNMFQISGLMKLTEGNLWQAELNALYLIRNRIWFGGGYRIGSNAQVMACINISENFRLGLSFDIATNHIRSFNDGSAEVFLGYNLKNKSGKSIRYF